MDEVTQQNAALVEEAAAAAESLVDQAASLTEVVSVFKLSGGSSFSAGKPTLRTIARKPPARLVSSSPKSATRPATPKVVARIGTSDGDWEEF
jgi:methyl-accepting chemotaxis protein